MSQTVGELADGQWLDLQTRAVFVELCLYNPASNLFTFLRMAAEFPHVGDSVVWRQANTLRLYPQLGAMGVYVLLCQVLAVLVVLVFSVKAALGVKRQKCRYCCDFWKVSNMILSAVRSTASLAWW